MQVAAETLTLWHKAESDDKRKIECYWTKYRERLVDPRSSQLEVSRTRSIKKYYFAVFGE